MCLMVVIQEHTRKLLEVILQLPENELLLQRHFGALLTVVRNMAAKRKAGVERAVIPRNIAASPKGGDFVALSNTTQPLSSLPLVSEKASRVNSSSDTLRSVAKALKAVREAEDPASGIMNDSLPLQRSSADKESHLEDDKFNISEFLKLDPGPGVLSDESAHLSSVKYKAVLISVEDLLGLKLPTAPVPPPSALRSYAENNADQRFRYAHDGKEIHLFAPLQSSPPLLHENSPLKESIVGCYIQQHWLGK